MSSASDVRTLLRRRSVALAKPPVLEDEAPCRDLLVVSVGATRFGLDVSHVLQILRNRSLCALPAGGGDLVGLVSARGEVVPVADLAALLNLAAADASRPYVVVVGGEQPSVGLLVDEVAAVESVAEHDVRGKPGGDSVESGVTSDGVVVLDARRLLDDPRLSHPTQRQNVPLSPASSTHRGDPCPT